MTPTNTPSNDELDEIFESCRSFEVGVANSYWFDETEAKKLILNWANKKVIEARETDEFGNPMVQLNMYEAKAVKDLIENLQLSNQQQYNTGDWFWDVPNKINAKIEALRKKGDV